ncbi:MAG TPA: hypothetical protein ENH84_05080 [Phycisphaerae bacterium]|nr:hypothetical protein [Phycisphaerae bacterium]
MTDEMNGLGRDVRDRIDAHLDEIDALLQAGGMSRSERKGITDDVEAQILEMLSARAGENPTLADTEAVLAELDPPEAYVDEENLKAAPPTSNRTPPAPTQPIKPRMSVTAIVGCVFAGLGVLLVTVIFLLVMSVAVRPGRSIVLGPMVPVLLLLSPPLLASTILGFVSISQIRHSAGCLYGLGVALFDAVLFPLLLLDVALFGAWCFILRFSVNYTVVLSVTVLTCIVVDWLLVRWAWRTVNKSAAV